jgi:hypothetical protein
MKPSYPVADYTDIILTATGPHSEAINPPRSGKPPTLLTTRTRVPVIEKCGQPAFESRSDLHRACPTANRFEVMINYPARARVRFSTAALVQYLIAADHAHQQMPVGLDTLTSLNQHCNIVVWGSCRPFWTGTSPATNDDLPTAQAKFSEPQSLIPAFDAKLVGIDKIRKQ